MHRHAHGHHHHHAHAHPGEGLGERALVLATAVNLLLTVVQIVAGVLAGSLALVADAVHNLSDALALAVALAARRIARWPAHPGMTFGYGRAEPVAALVNLTTLVAIGLYLLWEALVRFFVPEPVAGGWVMAVAGVALVIDTATALLVARLARESVNVRAAFLHNIADALGSVAVIVAGFAVWAFGWLWVDPLVTLLIAGYILAHGLLEMVPVVRLLMGATPLGLDPEEVAAAIRRVPGVLDVHHLHLWQITERELSLEAHVVVPDTTSAAEIETVKHRVKAMLAERFGIGHSTLEMELAGEASFCPDSHLVVPH